MSAEIAEEAEIAAERDAEEAAEKDAEEAASKDAEKQTMREAEEDSEKDVQKNLEKNMEKNMSEDAEEQTEKEAQEAGEQAENEAKDAGKSAEEAEQAGKDAENEVKQNAEKEIKSKVKSRMKKLLMAAAAAGLTTLEYLHVKHQHSGCMFPKGCKIPNPKPKAYKGSTKAGGLDKTYLENCRKGGIISYCQTEIDDCKKIKGAVVPGTKVVHGVSESVCDKLHGGYKSCGPLCVAKNTPKTVANQIRRGIHNLIGLTGDMLKYASYGAIVIAICFVLSLLMQL